MGEQTPLEIEKASMWRNQRRLPGGGSSQTTKTIRFDLVGPVALQKKTNIQNRDRALCVSDNVVWNPVQPTPQTGTN